MSRVTPNLITEEIGGGSEVSSTHLFIGSSVNLLGKRHLHCHQGRRRRREGCGAGGRRKAEEEAAAKKIVASEADINTQEADFSFEDAPAPTSKESLTPALVRKNLTAVAEDSDSEMLDAQPALHPAAGSKRKGAKKRALPLKSPRSSSAGPEVEGCACG